MLIKRKQNIKRILHQFETAKVPCDQFKPADISIYALHFSIINFSSCEVEPSLQKATHKLTYFY